MPYLYASLAEPTVVSHCITASFTDPDAHNLIVARSCVLEVYTIEESSSRLRLEGSFKLHGKVSAMTRYHGRSGAIDAAGAEVASAADAAAAAAAAATAAAGEKQTAGALDGGGTAVAAAAVTAAMDGQAAVADRLALGFAPGRVAIVEWDAAQCKLRTVALHQWEGTEETEMWKMGREMRNDVMMMACDPQGRVTATVVYGNKLIIMPDYVIDLGLSGIEHVKDICFLSGYYEPTLTILHTPVRAWEGRVRLDPAWGSKCTVSAMSINVTQRKHPIIWQKEELPYDAYGLEPVGSHLGGVVLLSPHALLYLAQSTLVCQLTTSYEPTEELLKRRWHATQLPHGADSVVVDGARGALIAPDRMLLSVRDGQMYVLSLVIDGRTVRGLRLEAADRGPRLSCLTLVTSSLLFLGSLVADSMLVQFGPESERPAESMKEDEERAQAEDEASQAEDEAAQAAAQDEAVKTEADADADDDAAKAKAEAAAEAKRKAEEEAKRKAEEEAKRLQEEEEAKAKAMEHDEGEAALAAALFGGGDDDDEEEEVNEEAVVKTEEKAEEDAAAVAAVKEEDAAEPAKASGSGRTAAETAALVAAQIAKAEDQDGSAAVGLGADVGAAEFDDEVDDDAADVAAALFGGDAVVLKRRADGKRKRGGFDDAMAEKRARYDIDAQPMPRRTFTDTGRYYFLVRDRLTNIGPVTDLAAVPSDGGHIDGGVPLSLVCTSGRGAEGGLAIADRCFRPTIVKTLSDLGGFSAVWAVYSRRSADAWHMGQHAFVVLTSAGEKRTSVMRVGEKSLEPVPVARETSFHVEGETLHVANVGGDRGLIMQIAPDRIIVLEGEKRAKRVRFGNKKTVAISADVVDPYVLVCTATGRLLVWRTEVLANDVVITPVEGTDELADVEAASFYHHTGSPDLLAPDVYVLLVLKGGRLQFRRLPSLALVWESSTGLVGGARQLFDDEAEEADDALRAAARSATTAAAEEEETRAVGVLADVLDESESASAYVAVTFSSGTLWTYRMMPTVERDDGFKAVTTRARVRLVKIEQDGVGGGLQVSSSRPARIFRAPGGGFAVSGTRPYAAFLAHSALRVYPLDIDGTALSWLSPLNAPWCDHGYIVQTDRRLRVCRAEANTTYESEVVVRRMPLQSTVHRLTYVDSRRVIICFASTKQIIENDDKLNPQAMGKVEDEHLREQAAERARLAGLRPPAPPAYRDQYEILTISTKTWTITHRFPLDKFEGGLDLAPMLLRDMSSREAPDRELVIVGTGYVYSEDDQCKGRTLAFRVEDGGKLKLAFREAHKASVVAVAPLNGYALCSVGVRMLMYKWLDEKLVGLSFIDLQFIPVRLTTVRNFILVADAYRSVQLIRYRAATKELVLMGKDYEYAESVGCQMSMHGRHVELLSTDTRGNVQAFRYIHGEAISRGGLLLVPVADMNLGSVAQGIIRVRTSDRQSNVQANVLATYDGGIGALVPIGDDVGERLSAVERDLVMTVEHAAGLNPRTFRMYDPQTLRHHTLCRNIVDSRLLVEYSKLSLAQQEAVALRVQERRSQIHKDIRKATEDLYKKL